MTCLPYFSYLTCDTQDNGIQTIFFFHNWISINNQWKKTCKLCICFMLVCRLKNPQPRHFHHYRYTNCNFSHVFVCCVWDSYDLCLFLNVLCHVVQYLYNCFSIHIRIVCWYWGILWRVVSYCTRVKWGAICPNISTITYSPIA